MRGVPSTTDIDQLDVMQGFVDLRAPTPLGDEPTLRSGRQEVLLGYQRLVSVREGPNVRRSFDGFRLSDAWNGATLDVLALRPVQDEIGAFNDTPNLNQALWGTYATVPVWGGLKADLYWLGYENDARHVLRQDRRGAAPVIRHAPVRDAPAAGTGTRRPCCRSAAFATRISAPGCSPRSSATPSATLPWLPRIALEGNASSGDNPAQRQPSAPITGCIPRLPYFAETSLLVPSNIHDVRPVLSVQPLPDVTVVAGWDTLWRTSTQGCAVWQRDGRRIRARRRRPPHGWAPRPRSTSAGGPIRI